MSKSITVNFKSGETTVFTPKGRPGGSYTIHLKLEPGWIKIVDEWDNVHAFPSDFVVSVHEEAERSW